MPRGLPGERNRKFYGLQAEQGELFAETGALAVPGYHVDCRFTPPQKQAPRMQHSGRLLLGFLVPGFLFLVFENLATTKNQKPKTRNQKPRKAAYEPAA